MEQLYSPRTITKLQKKYGFRFSKTLGQNFLTDQHIIDKIIEGTEITEDDLVIEIGPGMGVLTAEAAKKAGRVVAIELDKALIPILKETLKEFSNVELINADVLKLDLTELVNRKKSEGTLALKGVKFIGNLPYYITTPIIMKILEDGVPCDSITIMLQKEVADRIQANPGSKTYGALSVAVQYHCNVSVVAAVSKEVFIPKPKVDSSVIRLDVRKEKRVKLEDEAIFFALVKAGFGQRRKTLLNSLTGVCGTTKGEIQTVLEAVDIARERRAETLSLEEFASISNRFVQGFQDEKLYREKKGDKN